MKGVSLGHWPSPQWRGCESPCFLYSPVAVCQGRSKKAVQTPGFRLSASFFHLLSAVCWALAGWGAGRGQIRGKEPGREGRGWVEVAPETQAHL